MHYAYHICKVSKASPRGNLFYWIVITMKIVGLFNWC